MADALIETADDSTEAVEMTTVDAARAQAWRGAVEDIVDQVAPQHGLEAEELLNRLDFLRTLDSLTNFEPEDQALYQGVASAVESFVRVTEAVDTESTEDIRILSRVMEAKGTAPNGGRIFRVRLIRYGDSKNGRRYSEAVMRRAAPLYEGAKAYDHHRDEGELRSSTINGLIGQYAAVEARQDGLYADLHLLPGAKHAAEALDASITAQAAGLPPLVGLSHDVTAKFRPILDGGRRLQEATAIERVQSTDLVADPSAGGQAVRAVAGGIQDDLDEVEIDTTESTEEDEVPTTESVLDALKQATDEQLSAVGLSRAGTTEAVGESKDSTVGKLMIQMRLDKAGITGDAAEAVTRLLPERVTEASLDDAVSAYKKLQAGQEKGGLTPTVTTQVTQESVDKKRAAVDAMMAGDYSKGYRSFRQAFSDVTGRHSVPLGEDFNRMILRESMGYQGDGKSVRTTESLTVSSWDVILGDSITRRMVAEYNRPDLQTWQRIVSSTPPVNDFRTQRIDRLGGYGVLPTVNQGAPYQPLTSPTDEEVTYSVSKYGGTEDLTMEMIADDDLRAIQRIPVKLGLAAAQTLYRFVWDFLPTNAAIYDSVALFHATHNNTTTGALGQTSLSAARTAMRKQTAYGDTKDVLGFVPRFIIVPPDLEEIAFQLCTSAVAIPSTPAGAANTPNLHQGMDYVVVSYYSDTNDWFVVADPSMCPTIEIGFYQGRQEPELFTQSDPNVGSMFNNDTLTYKIRHIYSGAVLDFRGFYRTTN